MTPAVPSFADQRAAWRRVPVDDEGYLDAADLLGWPDDRLRDLVGRMERTRYGGWRNHENRWRTALGLDVTHGKRVLDYGCGVGLEALQYAKAGNEVAVADVNQATVDLAVRVLRIFGHEPLGATTIVQAPPPVRHPIWPGLDEGLRFDVIHCVGVLHHILDPWPVMEAFGWVLEPRGEVRLMVYSAQAWWRSVGTEPPDDVAAHPLAGRYAAYMDRPGVWADWYDRERLEARFGDLFTIRHLEHLTPDGSYLAATLTPNRKANQ